ncbi:MAG: hypothetical protein K2J14_03555, partial [Treponemataceae bacterium]|nr:hypothetical protein [Treponemataceae bacterium]
MYSIAKKYASRKIRGILEKRRYDKSTAQTARYFYHDKFPLETCISNATSHFITKWRKKARKKVVTFFLAFLWETAMN